jgi:hypothetical protein
MKRIPCLELALTPATGAQAGLFGPKGDSDAENKANVRKQRGGMIIHQFTQSGITLMNIFHRWMAVE